MFSQVKKFVWADFTFEGYHNYPDADKYEHTATGDEYDVSHLALRHFHTFCVHVKVEVREDNREIEFIQMRRRLVNAIGDKTLELNGQSCEMMCDTIAGILHEWYPHSSLQVDVSEEKMFGSTCFYPAKIVKEHK